MKAVVMGGGRGTRLFPMTDPLSKHALQVGDRPMIHHGLHTLARGGIEEVLVLLTWKHPGILVEQIGSGQQFGLDISFKYLSERDEANLDRVGPAASLCVTERWTAGEEFILILADSLYLCDLVFDNKSAPHIWIMPLDDFDDPSKYSQVRVAETFVTAYKEHPEEKFSNLIQTGVWLFPPYVFELIRSLQSKREGDLRVSEVVKALVEKEGMTYTMLPSESFIDLGTPEALLKGSRLVLEREARVNR